MKVTIAKNGQSGEVFTKGTTPSTDGKTYGFYVVNQSSISEEGGFIKEEKRSAILTVENGLGARLNYSEGMEKSGQVVRTESNKPFFKGQDPVINPTTKAVVTRGGQPLYRQDIFTADLDAKDSLLPRDEAAIVAPAKAGALAN